MSLQITWFGHASFRLASDDCVVYIDPWKLPNKPHDADVIFISHGHYDHCSPPDVQKVSRPDTTVIAPADVIAKLGATGGVEPGERLTVKGATIETVAAYNIGKQFHPRGNNWCGAVITLAGMRVYYSGDTDLIPEMSDLKDVDVALLPVGGTYTLTAAEAAKACKSIGCKRAIPYHWGDIVGTAADAKAFAKQAPCEVTVLQPGETTTV